MDVLLIEGGHRFVPEYDSSSADGGGQSGKKSFTGILADVLNLGEI